MLAKIKSIFGKTSVLRIAVSLYKKLIKAKTKSAFKKSKFLSESLSFKKMRNSKMVKKISLTKKKSSDKNNLGEVNKSANSTMQK